MSNWASADLSARPTSYTDLRRIYNQQTGAKGTSGVISDSPHQSDDEETTLLKEELRRLRERNRHHTPSIVTGRTYNSIQTSQPLATTTTTNVQFSTEGPVYHHHLVTNAVPSTSTDQTVSASEENSAGSIGTCIILFLCMVFLLTEDSSRSTASCLKTAWLIGLIITVIVVATVFLS